MINMIKIKNNNNQNKKYVFISIFKIKSWHLRFGLNLKNNLINFRFYVIHSQLIKCNANVKL